MRHIVGSDVTFQAMIGNHIERTGIQRSPEESGKCRKKTRKHVFPGAWMRLHPAEWIRESAGYMKEKNKTGNWLLNAVYPRRCPSVTDCCHVRNCIYAGIVWKRSIRFWVRGAKNAGNPWASEEEFWPGLQQNEDTASTAVLRRTVTTGNLRLP